MISNHVCHFPVLGVKYCTFFGEGSYGGNSLYKFSGLSILVDKVLDGQLQTLNVYFSVCRNATIIQ